MSKLLLILGLLLAASGMRVHKEQEVSVKFPPRGWVVGSRANPNTRISLVIMMKEKNLDKLEDIFWSVSDPKNPAYGQYFTFEEMHRITAPDQRAVDTVLHWLHQHHADVELEALPGHSMIRTVVPISVAEELLHAEYHEVHHADGHFAIRTASYSLPEEVADYIAVVGPTVSFPSTRRAKVTQPSAPSATTVDPTFIRTNYKVGSVESTFPKNHQATTGFLGQYMSVSDLNKFWSEYYPAAVGRNVTIVGPNGKNPGVEADLDIQYITAIGGNVTTEFWYFNGTAPDNPANEPFLDFLYYLGNDTDAPWVVSTSYGEDEDSVSLDYANACNVQFQKNSARGISILFASGDSGVGSDSGSCVEFAPQWPAASPYLTSVGASAVTITTAATFSSGGFSNRWPLQPWQLPAVPQYLSSTPGLPPASRYNSSGRAFPDIALVGEEYNIVVAGLNTRVAGTSCSTPAIAGIISLLNDLRFQAGKSSLGYLNQFLYQTGQSCPDCFIDVTGGSNPGCGTSGFPAAKGWDPATGFGGINYANMAQVVLQLP